MFSYVCVIIMLFYIMFYNVILKLYYSYNIFIKLLSLVSKFTKLLYYLL